MIQVFSTTGWQFGLRPQSLGQLDGADKFFRSVSRKDVRSILKGTRKKISGKIGRNKPYENLWYAYLSGEFLHIGCVIFTGTSLDEIKKWASKRRKS